MLKGRDPQKANANVRKSAVKICVSQMLCFLGKDENQQGSTKVSESTLGSVCPCRYVPARPVKNISERFFVL